ncbi:hypothetical protein ACH4TV_31550 [Streptomyces sp. NPDC020898]|uniref:hypothetical protein n=1 Tax=Streptomyces sp. NPDC020898 TaxID=3365101 RepID=UPI0037990A8D
MYDAGRGLPGLRVLDERSEPKAILPGSRMAKVLVSAYVTHDDEKHAEPPPVPDQKDKAGTGGLEKGGTRLLGVITASYLLHELLGAFGAP